MSRIQTWNGAKADLRDKLVNLLNKHRYIEFQGAPEKYHMPHVGQSILYDVPMYRQGHLKKSLKLSVSYYTCDLETSQTDFYIIAICCEKLYVHSTITSL